MYLILSLQTWPFIVYLVLSLQTWPFSFQGKPPANGSSSPPPLCQQSQHEQITASWLWIYSDDDEDSQNVVPYIYNFPINGLTFTKIRDDHDTDSYSSWWMLMTNSSSSRCVMHGSVGQNCIINCLWTRLLLVVHFSAIYRQLANYKLR